MIVAEDLDFDVESHLMWLGEGSFPSLLNVGKIMVVYKPRVVVNLVGGCQQVVC